MKIYMKTNICHVATHLTGMSDGIFTHIKMILENVNEEFNHFLIYQGNDLVTVKLKSFSKK